MAASYRLHIAQFLMFFGVAPMALAVTYALAVIYYAQSRPGQVGGSDAFLLFSMLLFSHTMSLVCGGSGALWSWHLTKPGMARRTTATMVLLTMVATALLGPLLWYISLLLF